jgi:branched-subunit amino acid aminotransferase/4-amino-4-deoxychorismate lyase
MKAGPNVNEFLMVGGKGEILEGSQTNFYAVKGGVVQTAGEGVLEGTVRRLLLEVCEREGVEVELRPPDVSEVEEWEGCMISSTSRLLLPVDNLYSPKEGEVSTAEHKVRSFKNDDNALAVKLARMVLEEVQSHSTPVDVEAYLSKQPL